MSRLPRTDHQIVAVAVRAFLALSALTAMFPEHARADGLARPARVDYEAPPTCPDARAFEGQMRARSSRIVISADAGTTVRVRIAGRAGRFEGEVAIVEAAGGPTQQRRVDGACTDVVAALSLIAALALDPMASTAATAAAATAIGDPSQATKPEAPKPPAPPPPQAPPVPQSPRDRDKAATPASDELPPAAELAKHEWRWSIGAGASVTSDVATAPLLAPMGFADVARVSRRVVSPAFRLRLERGSVDHGSASFTWTAGSIDGCPIALASGPLRAWPCARVEAGALAASGDVSAPKSTTRPWVSAGAVARARLALVGGLFLELEGSVFAPLVRDRFYLEPAATVHRAGAIGPAGGVALGASFW